MAKIIISDDLRKTVAANPHIKQVHFTESGDHFFHVHELKEKGKGTGKYYGHLNFQPVLQKVEGTRKIYKNGSVANPESEIVETLTRAQVLSAGKEAKEDKPAKPTGKEAKEDKPA
jgi:hypothetical protein